MLNRLSIGIKTFLRDDKLFHTIDAINTTMPEVQLIIADDGGMNDKKEKLYAQLERNGDKIIILPFDSGFGKKSNEIVDNLERDFLLVGSDDFDFSPPSVRLGIEKMVAELDRNADLSVVSGRVNNRQYEFYLREQDGVVEETRAPESDETPSFQYIDLTANYSLIRREMFNKVRWDDDAKIGQGEHGSFFLDVKRASFLVGFVPGVNINEQPGVDTEAYKSFRNRARSQERSCFKKRGVTKYVLGNGTVDYEETI